MRAGIVLLGPLTIVATIIAFPVGVGLIVIDALLAVMCRGMERKMLATIAIAGAVVCVAMALFLPGVWFSGETSPVTRL